MASPSWRSPFRIDINYKKSSGFTNSHFKNKNRLSIAVQLDFVFEYSNISYNQFEPTKCKKILANFQ